VSAALLGVGSLRDLKLVREAGGRAIATIDLLTLWLD
jgi:hypothetical protein